MKWIESVDRVDRASLMLSQPINGYEVDFFALYIIHFRHQLF